MGILSMWARSHRSTFLRAFVAVSMVLLVACCPTGDGVADAHSTLAHAQQHDGCGASGHGEHHPAPEATDNAVRGSHTNCPVGLDDLLASAVVPAWDRLGDVAVGREQAERGRRTTASGRDLLIEISVARS